MNVLHAAVIRTQKSKSPHLSSFLWFGFYIKLFILKAIILYNLAADYILTSR